MNDRKNLKTTDSGTGAGTGIALATAPAEQQAIIRPTEWMTRQADLISGYLPKRVDPSMWRAGAALAIASSNDLISALGSDQGRRTLMSALCKAASTGLSLNPQDGQCGFIPYSGSITYQVFAAGLIAHAVSTGRVREVRSMVVYANDVIEITAGTGGDTFAIRRAIDDPGEIRGFVAVATLPDGSTRVHYQSVKQVREWGERFGQRKQGKLIALWTHSFEGAGQKTVVKQLLSKLHLTPVEDYEIDADGVVVTAASSPAPEHGGASPADVSRRLAERAEREAEPEPGPGPETDGNGSGNTGGDLPFGPAPGPGGEF